MLAGFGADYAGNLLFNFGGFVIILLLALFTVRESAHIQNKHSRTPLKEHLHKSFRFAFGARTVRMVFVLSSLTALSMVTVETFWQPAFRAFSGSTLLYGVVGFIGFGGVVIGSKLAEWVLTRMPQRGTQVFPPLQSADGRLPRAADGRDIPNSVYPRVYAVVHVPGRQRRSGADAFKPERASRAAGEHFIAAVVCVPHRLAGRERILLHDQLHHGLPLCLADRRGTAV